MASEAAPEAAEQAPSLVDALQQLELPAQERLLGKLNYSSIAYLRLTCRALRDLADTSVALPIPLTVQLRADGTVREPVASLVRWGRRGGIALRLVLTAEASAAGVDALLPGAFTELPEPARRRVIEVNVSGSPGLSFDDRAPAVSGSAVSTLAAWLPCLRTFNLSKLPAGWNPGAAGEAYAALAALGTLEELELPGFPGLTGVETLAGSLQRLMLWQRRSAQHTLTLAAAAPLQQLTRLETLQLLVPNLDLGEGSTLQNLLSVLPPSLRTLYANNLHWVGGVRHGLDGTFGVSSGRLVSAQLHLLQPQALAALARDELLPSLGPGGRLESLIIDLLYADGWGSTDVAPLLELWRCSDQASVGRLAVKNQHSAADVCSALAAVGSVESLCLDGDLRSVSIKLALPEQPPPAQPAHAPLLDLPPPEEVLRMALQRLAPPGAGGEGGAGDGGWSAVADEEEEPGQMLLLRGPAAAAVLDRPSKGALNAWLEDLEQRARALAGNAFADGGPLVNYVTFLPPASTVLLGCSKAKGAAEAAAAAVAAAGDGTEVQRASIPSLAHSVQSALDWALGKVTTELWAASAGEGGPSLQQRVEWAMGVLGLGDGLPSFRVLYG